MSVRIGPFGLRLLCFLFVVAACPVEAAEMGRVGRMIGTPTLERAGRAVPLGSGLPIQQGDRIVTDAQARLEIQCTDGTILVIGPQSDLTVGTFAALSGKRGWVGALDLAHGILRIALAKTTRWDRFAVTSRTAIASVRSTVWIVDATPETTGVFVIEGHVRVASKAGKGQVDVKAGLGTDVAAGTAPSAPKPWSPERVEGLAERTKFAD